MNGYGPYLMVSIFSFLIGAIVGHWLTRHVVKQVAQEIAELFEFEDEDEDWGLDELNDWKDK